MTLTSSLLIILQVEEVLLLVVLQNIVTWSPRYINLLKVVGWPITLESPFSYTMVSLYAPSSTKDRVTVWDELQVLPNSYILASDFNMVTRIFDT